jgi:adenosylcobinamide-phosphate synthase
MNFQEWGGGVGPVILFVALVLDAVLPGGALLSDWVPHPRRFVRRLTLALDRRLNRAKRGDRARVLRGALMVLLFAAGAAGLGWGVERLAGTMSYGWMAELAVLTFMLSQRGVYFRIRSANRGLRAEHPGATRVALAAFTQDDLSGRDLHALARAALEQLASCFAAWLVAPVFWYLILGLPGAMVHATVNAMAAIIGRPGRRHGAFGLAAARLDDVLSAVPAWFAGMIIAIAALFVPGANPARALGTLWRDGGKHASFNEGRPVAAMAGALDLALGGPGEGRADAWIGTGRARADASDVARGLYLFVVACLIDAGIVAAIVAATQLP